MKQEIKFNHPGPTAEAMNNIHRFIAKKYVPIIIENRKEKGA